MSSIHLFGIRHHGPGCARSLVQALEQLQPDILLIEGPPEAASLLPLVTEADMQPPVALLLYSPAMPEHAVYYPFAAFSPEWQAIQYAQQQQLPTRFIDLPLATTLAQQASVAAAKTEETQDSAAEADTAEATAESEPEPGQEDDDLSPAGDALGWLASAAGFSDIDGWWDHLVEQRSDSLELFAAIEEMMSVARSELEQDWPTPRSEQRREAAMRQGIRAAQKEGFQKIAVVVGAWHVPALRAPGSVKADNELLKNLPKAKVAATWTPWTYGRLSQRSGYGAGIQAPGWYHHLWHTPNKAGLYFLLDCAALLRKQGLDASSAQIIEAQRLAETLASLRERSRPGLQEWLDALHSLLFATNPRAFDLIEKDLLLAERLGAIPAQTPLLPLQADVRQQQKSLRLNPSTDGTELELDLRQEAHLAKSVFLHRLRLLDIDWGKPQRGRSRSSGSFQEHWYLKWQPEFELALIQANVWGSSLESACQARICHQAKHEPELSNLTELVQQALLARCGAAVTVLMQAVQERAALTTDCAQLLAALPPLAAILRYGDTRGTDRESVGEVFYGLLERAALALPPAAHGINEEAAQALQQQMRAADEALQLLQREEYLQVWHAALQILAAASAPGSQAHPLLAGRATRILFEQGLWDTAHTAQTLSLACSNPIAPLASAQWLEGFLSGSGLLLILNEALWQILSNWVAQLPEEYFLQLLPLLRRTFATFASGERRQIGDKVLHSSAALQTGTGTQTQALAFDEARAALVLPLLQQIMLGTSATEEAERTEK